MFSTHLDEFKVQQKELHLQAANYHLVRSLGRSKSWISRAARSVGESLIANGLEIIKETR